MKYIKFGTYTGQENMQIDSDLLDEAIETQTQEPIFRLYAWKPRCISLGRNQKDDFDDITRARIKSFLGPWPRALEKAGLKEPRKK